MGAAVMAADGAGVSVQRVLHAATVELLKIAVARGTQDNVSAVVVVMAGSGGGEGV